jgi:hypothetical protein
MKEQSPYKPDAVLGDTWVRVETGTRAVRTLRAALLELAYALARDQEERRAMLFLVDPKISSGRIDREWEQMIGVLEKRIADRLSLVTYEKAGYHGRPTAPGAALQHRLSGLIRDETRSANRYRPPKDNYHELVKIMLLQWFLDRGPMTRDWLGRTAGCSYPTVAATLKSLGGVITRNPDRRIELARFPQESWDRIAATSEEARGTLRFADRSGQPRSIESLRKRLVQLGEDRIGVGGVLGARHYHPDLDLLGSPRLDLTVHQPGRALDLSFVEGLDPALHLTTDHSEPAQLIIHVLRRTESFFEQDPEGTRWADPVECLLDLHEARLERQTRAFKEHLIAARGSGL